MHYNSEYSIGRNLARSWSLGPGSLSCTLLLRIQKFLQWLCVQKSKKKKRGPLCATDLNGTVSPPFLECFVWSKWEFGGKWSSLWRRSEKLRVTLPPHRPEIVRSTCASLFVSRLMLRQSHSLYEGHQPKRAAKSIHIKKQPFWRRAKRESSVWRESQIYLTCMGSCCYEVLI